MEGETEENRAKRDLYNKSILDFVTEDASRLKSRLGYTDRHKLDEYLSAVRELEQRIQQAEKFAASQPDFSRPTGVPKQYEEHLKLMYDMMALAFQNDTTRVVTFITAHDAMWIQAGLRPAETVLIHSVGSGVGLAAVQLACALKAVPYGTSRTLDKISRAKEYGLEAGMAVRENFDELVTAVQQWNGGKGINVVLDLAGGPYVKASQKLMALKGRMMLVGTVAGANYELDSRFVMGKRLQIRGTVLRARALEEKILATQTFAAEVVPLLGKGILLPTIDSTFKMSEITKAHERLESNQTFGKVVVLME